ncbi:MAG: LysR family transcriptional regulator [Burkholderiaceae bacterium]|nr:LysR family transcriptional regulator [Burkholderiaceae bacterium]
MPPADDLRLPSLDALRAFEAAARLGSFERAADELAVTASAIGKRVAALESLIGIELLQRGGKALALTATGRDYLAQVRPALTLLMAVPQHRRPAQRTRKLRVSSPPTFARQVLVPALGEFGRTHPEVELEVVLSIPFLDLRPGEADIEIQHAPPGLPGWTVLMHDVVLPVASPALAEGRPCRTPADLAHWPLLRTPLEPWTPWFRAAGLDWPEPASGPMLVDLGLTLEAAVAGQGVALARPSLAGAWLASGTLRPLFALTAEPAQQYGLRHGPGDDAAVFAGWLGDRCARLAQEALELISGRT